MCGPQRKALTAGRSLAAAPVPGHLVVTQGRTWGAKQPRLSAPCATRILMTCASDTSTSIKSPPLMRSNRK